MQTNTAGTLSNWVSLRDFDPFYRTTSLVCRYIFLIKFEDNQALDLEIKSFGKRYLADINKINVFCNIA